MAENYFAGYKPYMPPSAYESDRGLNEGLDALIASQRFRREQDLKDRELLQKKKFEDEQNAAVMFGKQEAAQEHSVHEAQSQSRARADAVRNLSSLFGKGLTGAAQAEAAASVFENPRTHKMEGIHLENLGPSGPAPVRDDIGPAPEDEHPGAALGRFLGVSPRPPAPPPAELPPPPPPAADPRAIEPPPQPGYSGTAAPPPPGRGDPGVVPGAPPVFHADPSVITAGPEPTTQEDGLSVPAATWANPIEALKAASRAAQQQQDAASAYTQRGADADTKLAADTKAHGESERWQMQFPGYDPNNPETADRAVTFDPREQKLVAINEAKERAQQYRAAAARAASPDERAQWLRQADLEEARASGQDRASVNTVASQENAQGFKAGQSEIYDLTAAQKMKLGLERAKNAGRNAQGDWRELETRKRDDITEANYAQKVTMQVLGKFGFSDVQVQNRKFNSMASSLGADPNAALDAVISGSFVKMAQGGTGVISDKDMSAFWDRIGDIGIKTGQRIQDILSGKILPEKRAIVADAVHELASQARGNLDAMRQSLDHALTSDPVLGQNPQWKMQALGTYFPEEREKTAGQDVKPPPRVWQKPRHGQHGPVASPAATAPAAPQAAAPSMTPQAALQMARERLKTNPNDEYALKVVKKYGGGK
jgi:hypothetical protein